jgi:hypothetical protein
VKLGLQQQLTLVVSGSKPPWTWAALGLFALAAGATALKWKRVDTNPTAKEADPVSGETDGLHLRVSRDFGVQTIESTGDDGADQSEADNIIRMRVLADLGEQTVGPVNDKGELE